MESGGEPFDLCFEARQHVDGGSVRDVAIGPGGVAIGGGARGVEEARLGQEDEGSFGVVAGAHRFFGGGDFFESSAQVDGGGLQAFSRFPRNGIAKGVVDFEDSGAVLVIG